MKVKILSDQKDLRSPKQLVIGMNTDVPVPSNQAVEINYSIVFFQKHGLLRWVSEFKPGTAGDRDTINLADLFNTDAPYNAQSSH